MKSSQRIKKASLQRRIDAFFTANPGEGLALSDACAKFECSPAAFAQAVRKANMNGLGLGLEPYYRLGVSSRPQKRANRTASVPVRPRAESSSIFAGNPPRVRMMPSAPVNHALLQVNRDGGSVIVERILEQDTAEWKERERVRRAKQKPPRPAAGAKTRSKKLLELIGPDK